MNRIMLLSLLCLVPVGGVYADTGTYVITQQLADVVIQNSGDAIITYNVTILPTVCRPRNTSLSRSIMRPQRSCSLFQCGGIAPPSTNSSSGFVLRSACRM